MHLWIKYIILVILLSSACSHILAQQEQLRQEIDKIIRYDTEINYPLEKSFIVGVIVGDSTYRLNFGPDSLKVDDLFEMGGVTKVFTGTLLTHLSNLNLIDLSAPINSLLPVEYRNHKLEPFSIHDLLLYNIPFPKRPSNLGIKNFDVHNPYKYYTKLDLLNFYKNFIPLASSKYDRNIHYSHINYGLLEIILEYQFNLPFSDILAKYLLNDLELIHTQLYAHQDSIMHGYDKAWELAPAWEFESFAASEGLTSTLEDLILWTRANIEEKTDFIENAQTVHKKLRWTKRLKFSNAWYILYRRKTGNIYTHSGSTSRHKVYIHFKKESKTGVILVCNSSEGVGELSRLIFRMINNNWKKNGKKE